MVLNDVVPVVQGNCLIFPQLSCFQDRRFDVVLKDGRQDQGFEARADVDDLRRKRISRVPGLGRGGCLYGPW